MKLAILVVSRNRPAEVEALVTRIRGSVAVPHQVFVVEQGTRPELFTPHSAIWFADGEGGERRGEGYGFNLALQAALMEDEFEYCWILTSDVALEAGTDVAGRLIRVLDKNPRMAILAPSPDGVQRDGTGGWRAVATFDGPGFVMRAAAVVDAGFLNPDFRSLTGAVDELCHRLHERGWFVAETDEVCCPVAGVSADDGERLRAEGFALEYLRRYGEDWDEVFWRAASGHGIRENRFADHRRRWSRAACSSDQPAAAPALPEPWPLGTDATHVLFAWPRYDRPTELDALLGAFGQRVQGRRDVCLCLRHDAELDGSQTGAVAALEESSARVLGPTTDLEILLVDDALAEGDWARLGRSVTAVVPLPSSREEPRRSRLVAMNAPVLTSEEELERWLPDLAEGSAAPRYTTAELDSVDWELVEAIKSLHPWRYPVHVGNLAVRAGLGAAEPADELSSRIHGRAARLVVELERRLSLSGKSVLEVACDCGFWGARWAERGAARWIGIEPDSRARRQAQLYWSRNRFLPPDAWRLLDGDPAHASTWDDASALGPHDVTLITSLPAGAGADELEELLRRAGEVTREALIVDLEDAPRGAAERVAAVLRLVGFGLDPHASLGEVSGGLSLLARRARSLDRLPAALPAARNGAGVRTA